jgi:hypothetical protein
MPYLVGLACLRQPSDIHAVVRVERVDSLSMSLVILFNGQFIVVLHQYLNSSNRPLTNGLG